MWLCRLCNKANVLIIYPRPVYLGFRAHLAGQGTNWFLKFMVFSGTKRRSATLRNHVRCLTKVSHHAHDDINKLYT